LRGKEINHLEGLLEKDKLLQGKKTIRNFANGFAACGGYM